MPKAFSSHSRSIQCARRYGVVVDGVNLPSSVIEDVRGLSLRPSYSGKQLRRGIMEAMNGQNVPASEKTMTKKQCITCNEVKDESKYDFRNDRQKLRGECKACRRKREKKPEYQDKRRKRQKERYKDPEYREKYNEKRKEKLRKTSPK